MEIFCVESKALNSLGVKLWVIELMEKGVLMGSNVEAVIDRHIIYQSTQTDGTRLDVMYINSDHETLLINRQGEQIIQGNFLVGYKPSFGNPLPFIKRTVISMEGLTSFDGLAEISVGTDYQAIEDKVEQLRLEAEKPSKKGVVSSNMKHSDRKCVPASKSLTTDYVQQSLF